MPSTRTKGAKGASPPDFGIFSEDSERIGIIQSGGDPARGGEGRSPATRSPSMSGRLVSCLHLLLVGLLLAATSSPSAAQAVAGKKYALLVGVKEYDHSSLTTLQYT